MQEINKTTFKVDKISKPERKVEIEIGDAKQEEFYPQFKTKHWDNECNFSIRLIDDNKGVVEHVKDKIEYTNGKRKVRLYEKETGDEDGGFEFDITLEEKPKSNVLEFTIQSKELDFFYQPELTEEEKKEGAVRPENVIGSYAVYHKSKKNNIVGGKEYRTGKAFHIYRPYAEDAKGNKVWCDLNIKDDTLTVTIPQNFLDTAVYPVLVDPTMGYTSVGASVVSGDRMQSFRVTSSEAGDISKLTAYAYESAGTAGLAAAIYDDNSNPNNLLSQDTGNVTINTTQQWVDINLSYTITASVNYWLVVWGEATSNVNYFRYDTTTGEFVNKTQSGWDTFPTTYGTPTYTTSSRELSLYATYTASGGSVSITKSLQYAIKTTPSAKTKALEYNIETNTSLTKSIEYKIKTSNVLTKALEYAVIKGTTITKTLEYDVEVADVYSRENNASLPTDNADLSTVFSGSEKTDVSTDDGVRVDITGSSDKYIIQQFKKTHTNDTDTVTITWNGQVDIAPSEKAVYLQIYNHTTASWETVASDNTSVADVDFTLTGAKTGSDYYDASNQVTARVYQVI